MAYKTIPALLLLLAILLISPPAAQGAYKRLPGALTWVTTSNSGDTWGVNAAQNIYHVEKGNWVLKPGLLVQISAGVSGVWGVTQSDTIFRWNGAGWVNIPGFLRRVSSGSSVWGVNRAGNVYRYLGNGAWKAIPSPWKMKDISAGDNGRVWAITQDSRILHREVNGWRVIPGLLEKIAVGSAGVWGVNSLGEVYSWAGPGWAKMEGSLAQLDSGRTLVGVNRASEIYEWREVCPAGTAWDNESQFCLKCAGGKRRLLAGGTCDVSLLLFSYLLRQLQNGLGQPPTVPDILSNSDVQRIMCIVWRMSILGNNRYQERGGWIYALPSDPRRIYVRMANVRRSQPALDGARGSNPSIDLNNPDSSPGNPAPRGYVVVANFHTHPFPTANQEPSTSDRENAYFRGVPGIVLSRNRVYYYGPQSRLTMAGVRGYPGSTGEVFNGQGSRTLEANWWPCPPP